MKLFTIAMLAVLLAACGGVGKKLQGNVGSPGNGEISVGEEEVASEDAGPVDESWKCDDGPDCPVGSACLEDGSCCWPAACGGLGAECGPVDDGCGGTSECGQCQFGGSCAEGVCVGAKCEVMPVASLTGSATDIATDGTRGFVALDAGGLHVVSLTPQYVQPEAMHKYADANKVAVAGGLLYVQTGPSIKILDIPAEGDLQEVGEYSPAISGLSTAADFHVLDSGMMGVLFAYQASPGAGGALHFVDVSDPESPTFLGQLEFKVKPVHVHLHGTVAYVGYASNQPAEVVDFSTPSAPTVIASLDVRRVVHAEGGYLYGYTGYYLDSGWELSVYDNTNPLKPKLLGQHEEMGGWQMSVSGSIGCLAASKLGVRFLDLTDPSAPQLLGSYDTAGDAWACSLEGDRAYVADGQNGVIILDATAPDSPKAAGRYHVPGYPRAVSGDGGFVYTASGAGGMKVVDAREPVEPLVLGSFGTGNYAPEPLWAMHANGELAVLPLLSAGMLIVDVKDPSAPALLSMYAQVEKPLLALLEGDYAYLAANASPDFHIVKVKDPLAPKQMGVIEELKGVSRYALDVEGDFAYIVSEAKGKDSNLVLVDISTPSAPKVAGNITLPHTAEDICVHEQFAYVTVAYEGVHVVDVSKPEKPKKVALIKEEGENLSVAVHANSLFLAGAMLKVYDISTPQAPAFRADSGVEIDAYDIYVAGGYAFVAADRDGLQVFDVGGCW